MSVSEPATRSVSRSSWARSVAQAINSLLESVASLGTTKAEFEGGDYVPSLTNWTVGTGGSANMSAKYSYVGGPEVGDYGILSVSIRITLGDSGLSVGSNPQFGIPSGFEWLDGNGSAPKGSALLLDSNSTDYIGAVTGWSTSTVRVVHSSATGITSSSPFTWAAGDILGIEASGPVIRV